MRVKITLAVFALGMLLSAYRMSSEARTDGSSIRGRVYWQNLTGEPPATGLQVQLLKDEEDAVAESRTNNVRKSQALYEAVKKGNIAAVQTLISQGVDVNSKSSQGAFPLYTAALNGNAPIVRLLLSKGADANVGKGDYTPLFGAAQEGYLEIATMLIASGADVNARSDDNGMTPLLMAASSQKNAVGKLLLEKGAAVDSTTTTDAKTPIMMACGFAIRFRHDPRLGMVLEPDFTTDDPSLVQALLAKGADIQARDKANLTPLNHCVSSVMAAKTKALLAKGADVNEKYPNGNTPLFEVFDSALGNIPEPPGFVATLQVLLDAGANVKDRNSKGETALMIIAKSTHSRANEVKTLLKKYGATE